MALASNYNLADEAERNSMMEKARGVIHAASDGAAQDAGDGVLRWADALGDRRDDGRSAGHGEDENTQRADFAEKGIYRMSERTAHYTGRSGVVCHATALQGRGGGGLRPIWRSRRSARRELAEIQGDLAIYAHTVDMHSPPAQARERLMKQVAREKKAVPIERAGRSGDCVRREAIRSSMARCRSATEARVRTCRDYLTEEDRTEAQRGGQGVAMDRLGGGGWTGGDGGDAVSPARCHREACAAR